MTRAKKVWVIAPLVLVAAALTVASLRSRGMSIDEARRWLDARVAAHQSVVVEREPLWGAAHDGDAFDAHAEAIEVSQHLLAALGVEADPFDWAVAGEADGARLREIDALLQQAGPLLALMRNATNASVATPVPLDALFDLDELADGLLAAALPAAVAVLVARRDLAAGERRSAMLRWLDAASSCVDRMSAPDAFDVEVGAEMFGIVAGGPGRWPPAAIAQLDGADAGLLAAALGRLEARLPSAPPIEAYAENVVRSLVAPDDGAPRVSLPISETWRFGFSEQRYGLAALEEMIALVEPYRAVAAAPWPVLEAWLDREKARLAVDNPLAERIVVRGLVRDCRRLRAVATRLRLLRLQALLGAGIPVEDLPVPDDPLGAGQLQVEAGAGVVHLRSAGRDDAGRQIELAVRR